MGHAAAACPELHPKFISLGRQLGAGAFAIVYAAVIDGEDVAIKVLRRKYDKEDDAQYAMLLKEGALLCACNHPHIVQCKGLVHLNSQHVAGLGEDDGSVGLVLELSKVGSLQEYLLSLQHRPSHRLAHRIHRQGLSPSHSHTNTPSHSRTHSRSHSRTPSYDHGYGHHHHHHHHHIQPYRHAHMAHSSRIRQRYTLKQAMQWIMQLASALEYLHSKDPHVLHRDIKLENVLLFPVPSTDIPHAPLGQRLSEAAAVQHGTANTAAHNRTRSWSEDLVAKQPQRSSVSETRREPCSYIVKLADFGLHQCITSDRAVYLRRGKMQQLGPSSPSGSHHSHHSPHSNHSFKGSLYNSGVASGMVGLALLLSPTAASSREGSLHPGSFHRSGAMAIHAPQGSLYSSTVTGTTAATAPRGSLYSSTVETTITSTHQQQQLDDPAAATGLFFTLDEAGIARSSGNFLSPSAVAASARKSSRLSPYSNGTSCVKAGDVNASAHDFPLRSVTLGARRPLPSALQPVPDPQLSPCGASSGSNSPLQHCGAVQACTDTAQLVDSSSSTMQGDDGPAQQQPAEATGHYADGGQLEHQQPAISSNPMAIQTASTPAAQGRACSVSQEASAASPVRLKTATSYRAPATLNAISGRLNRMRRRVVSLSEEDMQALGTSSCCTAIQLSGPIAGQECEPETQPAAPARCSDPPVHRTDACMRLQPAGSMREHRPHVSFALPDLPANLPASASGMLHCSNTTRVSAWLPTDGVTSHSMRSPSAVNPSVSASGGRSLNALGNKSSNASGTLSLYSSKHGRLGPDASSLSITDADKVQLVMPQCSMSMGSISRAPTSAFQTVFALTGETGSLLYMPPEVFKRQPYNCQVDVFSLAMLAWQLLECTPLTTCLEDMELNSAREWAVEVSAGHRPPQPRKCPQELWSLLCRCWDEDPLMRPSAQQVVLELQHILSIVEDDDHQQAAGAASDSPPQQQLHKPTPCCSVS